MNDSLTDTVVHISHKLFLSSCKVFKFPLGRTSAFGLELLAEIGISSSDIFHLFGTEELVIGANCEIDNPPINHKNFLILLFRGRLLLNRHMEKERTISISEGATLDFPIKILVVMFSKNKGGLDSSINGGNA